MKSCIFCKCLPDDNNNNNDKSKKIIGHIKSNITFTLVYDKNKQMITLYVIICDRCTHNLKHLAKYNIKGKEFERVKEKNENYIVKKFKSIYDYIKQKIL